MLSERPGSDSGGVVLGVTPNADFWRGSNTPEVNPEKKWSPSFRDLSYTIPTQNVESVNGREARPHQGEPR